MKSEILSSALALIDVADLETIWAIRDAAQNRGSQIVKERIIAQGEEINRLKTQQGE